MRFFLIWMVLICAARADDDVLKNLRSTHPRLLVTGIDTFAALKREAERDPLRAQLHHQIVAAAEVLVKAPPIAHVLIGPRMLEQSRKAIAHVVTCAMAYRLTGEVRFALHARDTMLTAAAFTDWNPSHFLDVAEMATALAIGHDWLYDQLSPEERNTIERALADKALAFARPAYLREDPTRESFPFVGNNLTNNWNQVCNGGFLLAALAVAEREPELARFVIAGVRETLPYAVKGYEPDGAYPEGPVYWGYGTRYDILVLAALESALGTDFALGKLPGFDRTALYRVQVESPTMLFFNYADGRPRADLDPGLTWLGLRYHHAAALEHNRNRLSRALAGTLDGHDRFLALHALWFPASGSERESLALDAHFRGPSEVAIFRSAWTNPDALWVGFKAGSNSVNHGHLDLGSFVLDADGERWACDLGPDDYNLPGYWESKTIDSRRWGFYRLNNLSHNTLTPDEDRQSPDATASLIAWQSTPERAFAIADLTPAYPGRAKRFHRGLAMIDRARVLVQDEVQLLTGKTTLTWRMLTPAVVTCEHAQAVLTQNGRRLRAEILAPANAEFGSRRATPPTAAEDQNAGITELFFRVPASAHSNVRIAVLLTPIGERWGSNRVPPNLTALEAWK